MRYSAFEQFLAMMALWASVGCMAALAQSPPLSASDVNGVGKPATQEDIGNYGWASGAAGKSLPPGKGTAKDGQRIFTVKCAMCHGLNAEGNTGQPGSFSGYMGRRLGGGNSVPLYNMPPGKIATIAWRMGSATAIFNTIAIEMPEFKPASLTPDEVYALTAFILFKNNLIKEDQVMDRETLPKVQMPNRNNAPGGPTGSDDAIYMDMWKRGCIQTFNECRDR
jgi:mono/diheme cytochrome c family protein